MTDSSAENYDPSKDPARKAKSSDPAWKFGFWPDLSVKDVVQCSLYGKKMHSGVRRLKQHLAGGFADIAMCSKTNPTIIKEMKDYMQKYMEKSAKKNYVLQLDDDDGYDEEIQPTGRTETEIHSTGASNTLPTPGTSSKRKAGFQFVVPQQSKPSKSIASMIRKTPEEVIEERHSSFPSQTSLENCTKSEEEKERVKMHIANFFL